jgi:hypothetical protein
MTKYNVEGGIDFYNELYAILDQPDDDNANDKTVCLITNDKLTDRYFEMKCGHKFNYVPLYKDLVNHRKKFNSMESGTNVLSKSEIRCPYCRERQTGVLPYYEDMGLDLMEGVNAVHIKPVICSFVWSNEHFDDTCKEDDFNQETIKCCHEGFKTVLPDSTNVVFYCGKHEKVVLYKHAKELKDKQKQAGLAAKLKDKEEKALAKESAKAVAVANKALAVANKALAKAFATEDNVIISSENWCVEILKTGDKKGHQCSYNKANGQARCKRHHNLLIKKNL